ncbi:hypothetical protein HMPREF0972_00037 [Actinomyces sp. oral taxon 848 str. F0332]|nr:hypothetical protein HMPREF0972_00037 [Actinomyces sp. oral taxon 848 str. F0332]
MIKPRGKAIELKGIAGAGSVSQWGAQAPGSNEKARTRQANPKGPAARPGHHAKEETWES